MTEATHFLSLTVVNWLIKKDTDCFHRLVKIKSQHLLKNYVSIYKEIFTSESKVMETHLLMTVLLMLR